MELNPNSTIAAIAVGLALVLAAALESGFRLGRRARSSDASSDRDEVGVVQGATLGLLGLLLAFSFGGAAARFIERQDLIVAEANAIGTSYLRADLLPEAQRRDLRASLAEYTNLRIEHAVTKDSEAASEFARREVLAQERVWRAASDGVLAKPEITIAVLGPVNETLDLHALRSAAQARHLPNMVLGLLIACSLLSMLAVGYGCGLAGRRSILVSGGLVFLIAAALWTTIDLDHPRVGLIQVSDRPLVELAASFAR